MEPLIGIQSNILQANYKSEHLMHMKMKVFWMRRLALKLPMGLDLHLGTHGEGTGDGAGLEKGGEGEGEW